MQTQLSFDFGSSEIIQKFLGIIKFKKFRTQDDFYIKKNLSPKETKPYYVSRRYFDGVDVDWSFISFLTQEEAEILEYMEYASFY